MRRNESGTVFNLVGNLLVLLFMLFCLLPMVLVFMVSITEESAISANGYSFVPERFSLEAYRLILFGDPLVGNA